MTSGDYMLSKYIYLKLTPVPKQYDTIVNHTQAQGSAQCSDWIPQSSGYFSNSYIPFNIYDYTIIISNNVWKYFTSGIHDGFDCLKVTAILGTVQ